MTDDLRARVEALIEDWRSLPVWGPDERGLHVLDGVDHEGLMKDLRALLTPAPASEPLSPGAKVSLPSKAAQSPGSETARCEGDAFCSAPLHVHGCFADFDGSSCDDPADHDEYFAPTPPTTVQADRGAPTLRPVMRPAVNPGALSVLAGFEEVQADRDATYQPCSHECNGCPTCDPGLAQTDRDAGQVRLTEDEVELLAVGQCHACRQGTYDVEPCECGPMLYDAVEHILAARAAQSDATERVEWGVRWGDGDGEMVAEYAGEAVCRRLTRPTDTVVRRTVTTGEWEEA